MLTHCCSPTNKKTPQRTPCTTAVFYFFSIFDMNYRYFSANSKNALFLAAAAS